VSELLNLVGLSTGIVLYAMLLAMVVRGGGSSVKSRLDPLLLVTAILGLVWNLSALPVYELPKVGIDGPFPWLAAIGFCALGLLPAVVVHSVLRRTQSGPRGTIEQHVMTVAYVISGAAAVLQLQAAFAGRPVPSPVAMRLLTYTFVALVIPLAVIRRGQPGSRRALWAAALAIFAVSGLHLSQLHRDATWPIELLGHHASLPLALAILYQDYPFALADLFLKRALALVAIIALTFVTLVAFGGRSDAFSQFIATDPKQVGVLVTLWVATALAYPLLRHGTARFVDAVVLRRADYRVLRGDIVRGIHTHDDPPALLDWVCRILSPALSATVTWAELPPMHSAESLGSVILKGNRATVVVPTGDPPAFVIEVGELTGGRRFLSDDVATLESISGAVARRIDAIRITQERYDRAVRDQEIAKLATQAELRALRAQINPHFLFNALTTIGYLIQTAPPKALDTLMHLTALLRAVLRSEGEFSTLGRELHLIESYLDIERARFEQRLRVSIQVPHQLRDIRLPPLVLQPLVENAVKHGIASQLLGGEVAIRATLENGFTGSPQLTISVHDTGEGATTETFRRGRQRGVGLRNVERRLECQYGPAASLSIHSALGEGTTVEIRLPVASHWITASDRSQAVN
jgi:two-component system, LytTR family, sensor kinase